MFTRRLLLLTETFPPEVGGIQQYLAGLWAALPPERSSVIAPDAGGAEEWDVLQRYRVVRTPMRGWTYPRWRPALQTLRSVVRDAQPDVLVCGKALFEGRAAQMIQREMPIPYVVMTYAMEVRTWLSGWNTRRDLLRVLQGAARIVVINASTKQLLLDHGIPERKIVKIYPGVGDSFFQPTVGEEEFRERLGLQGKRVLVSVCRLIPRKGIDVVLHAIPEIRKAVPNIVSLIVGTGPGRPALERLAKFLGVQDAVRFLGQVSQDDLRKALAIGDLFVLTPRGLEGDVEGFGMVYLEAAAAGLTSVGSTSGGVPEAVLDGRTGLLVPPANPQEVARVIIRLLRDDARRTLLATAAKARAEREFTWSRRALLFRGVMEAVVQEKTLKQGK